MLKKLFEYFGHLFSLGEATRDNKAEIKEIRRELRDSSLVVQRLNVEIQGLREENRQQKENILLQIENQILRSQKALPRPKSKQGSS